jgi:hypothetical protein
MLCSCHKLEFHMRRSNGSLMALVVALLSLFGFMGAASAAHAAAGPDLAGSSALSSTSADGVPGNTWGP